MKRKLTVLLTVSIENVLPNAYITYKNNLKTKLFRFSVSASEFDNHFKEEKALLSDRLVSVGVPPLLGLDSQILTSLVSL